jgi:hypothetical protein
MKKLILFLIFGLSVLSLNAQIWSGSIKSPQTKDTVVYSSTMGIGDISGYFCSCTFDLSSLTAAVKVEFGGSEKVLSTTYQVYAFQKYASDSLPYTISVTAFRDTTNARSGRIATNIKTFIIPVAINHKSLGIRVTKLTNTGLLPFDCLFVKKL